MSQEATKRGFRLFSFVLRFIIFVFDDLYFEDLVVVDSVSC